ncbi:MAG: SIS domain-containing protein [Johnsonella sp.]|nr:SIS domain-containing protein [Johnsonella sp.]
MKDHIARLGARYPALEPIRTRIEEAFELIRASYDRGGKLLIAGNGGSAADSEHIVGELMKGFVKKRELDEEFKQKLCECDSELGKKLAEGLQKSLRAIALTSHTALSTAFANDVDPEMLYAQQLNGYGDEGDVFLAISTSGNAKNLYYAALTAKAKGMKIILLGGRDGGRLKALADISLIAPSDETFMIQEYHLPIYHALCLQLEEYFF